MEYVRTEVLGKTVILLSGTAAAKVAGQPAEIKELDQLLAAVRRSPDAVAFGYVTGRWIAGA